MRKLLKVLFYECNIKTVIQIIQTAGDSFHYFDAILSRTRLIENIYLWLFRFIYMEHVFMRHFYHIDTISVLTIRSLFFSLLFYIYITLNL